MSSSSTLDKVFITTTSNVIFAKYLQVTTTTSDKTLIKNCRDDVRLSYQSGSCKDLNNSPKRKSLFFSHSGVGKYNYKNDQVLISNDLRTDKLISTPIKIPYIEDLKISKKKKNGNSLESSIISHKSQDQTNVEKFSWTNVENIFKKVEDNNISDIPNLSEELSTEVD